TPDRKSVFDIKHGETFPPDGISDSVLWAQGELREAAHSCSASIEEELVDWELLIAQRGDDSRTGTKGERRFRRHRNVVGEPSVAANEGSCSQPLGGKIERRCKDPALGGQNLVIAVIKRLRDSQSNDRVILGANEGFGRYQDVIQE